MPQYSQCFSLIFNMLTSAADDLWMLNMSAQCKWMRNTPGWLLALIPDYLCLSNPSNREKLAEERGLFECMLEGDAVSRHTYLSINITNIQALTDRGTLRVEAGNMYQGSEVKTTQWFQPPQNCRKQDNLSVLQHLTSTAASKQTTSPTSTWDVLYFFWISFIISWSLNVSLI